MSEFLVGNELLGTFKPSRDVGDISQYSLERMENSLYLKGPDRISLEPYDEAAANVIANFSLEVDDFNESIYRMYKQGSDVEVVLMTFVSVIRLDADGKSLVIHLRPSDEDNVIHNEEGLNGIKAGGIDEIPQVLADLFISHQSIFVFEGRNDNNKSFQMLGDGYVANILMERPGVYVIDRIIKPRGARDRNAVCSISQIFGHGNIRFVTSNQALSERGNDDSVITPVRTSEIFDAWQEYAEFQKRIYEEDLGKCLYPFQDLHVEGERIRIHLERPLGYFEDGTPDLVQRF